MGPKIQLSDEITAGYHGTTLEAAQEIAKSNFKLTPPNSGAYLGEGVYFFDNQPSQAKNWARFHCAPTPGSKIAVIQSKIKYGRLLNLTDRESYNDVQFFAREYQRKANTIVTLPTIIDIVAEKLDAEVVKAIRIPNNIRPEKQTGFTPDVEVILAVRDLRNILSREQIWSQMTPC